jgi:hypothetical protein
MKKTKIGGNAFSKRRSKIECTNENEKAPLKGKDIRKI